MKYYAKKDLSTKKNTPPEEARLPEPQRYKDRKKGAQSPKTEGTLAPDSLKPLFPGSTPLADNSPQSKAPDIHPDRKEQTTTRWGGKKRIRSRREFSAIYTHGKNYFNDLAVLKFLPNERDYSRAAFSVGKKLGKAAKRNRIKRLMREALRSLEVNVGWDLLFIARPAMMESNFHEVRAALEKVLDRAGILRTKNAGLAK